MAVLERMIGVRNNRTIYRDGAHKIKVFEAGTEKADVFREAFKLAAIESVGLEVPKIHGVEEQDGKWMIISEYIGGKTLDRLMLENPEDRSRYLEQFVKLHCSIHSQRMNVQSVRSIERMTDEVNRLIAASDLPATVRFDLHSRLDRMPKADRLCHGDFNPTNVVFSRDGKPYILDWEYACCGDPCADAAVTYLEFCLDGEEAAAEEYCRLYCESAECDISAVHRWIPVMAAALSVGRVLSEREKLIGWMKNF